MKKLMQWTFFLDILGYGEEQKKIDTKEKANEFMEIMKENKSLMESEEIMAKEIYTTKSFNIYEYYDFKSTFISDSFVITAIPKDKLCNDKEYYNYSTFAVMELSIKIFEVIENILAKKGLLFRGGISNKFTDIDTDNNLAVGQGLIEAYKLESSFAVVPRIILSKEVSDNEEMMSYFKMHGKPYGNDFSIFIKDTNRDDLYYLDYLGFIVSFMNRSEKRKQTIQDELKKNTNKEAVEKIENLLQEKNQEEYIKLMKLITLEDKILESTVLEIGHFHSIKKQTLTTIEKLYDTINLNLKVHSTNIKTFEKYVWLREYLNETIERFPDLAILQKYKIS